MDTEALLIAEIRKRPAIYDRRHADFKSLKRKSRAWSEVVRNTNLDGEQCKKRWKGLRDTYKRIKRNGVLNNPKAKKWRYYDALSFLDKAESSRSDYVKEDSVGRDLLLETQCEEIADEVPFSDEASSPVGFEVQNESVQDKFMQFLEAAAVSISETCTTFSKKIQESNSTSQYFESLARNINEINMPKDRVIALQSKVSSVVFTEIENWLQTQDMSEMSET